MIKISCDPEMFIGKLPENLSADLRTEYVKKTQIRKFSSSIPDVEGLPIPVCTLIGGTKHKPIPIPSLEDGFYMQEDGCALEFNIPACGGTRDFTRSVYTAMRALFKHLHTKGFTILQTPVAAFSQEDLEKYPQANILGCSPDYNAYTLERRFPPDISELGTLRFAGGHLHMSFENPQQMPLELIVRILDIYLGLPLLNLDKQGLRRKFYGLAGLYRPTKYPDGSTGLEYRVLSNFWIFNSNIQAWMINTLWRVLTCVETNPIPLLPLLEFIDWEEIPPLFESEDVTTATKILRSIRNLALPWYPEAWEEAV